MKTIGIIGGMSWRSTVPYYRLINEGVKERPGGLHSARIILLTGDFHDIAELQTSGRWDEAGVIYTELRCSVFDDGSRARFREIIGRLVAAGAEGIILGCTEIPLLLSTVDSPVPLFDTRKLHAAAAVDFALAGG